MGNMKILDCTLRDGGYVVDTVFGEKVIKDIINSLAESGIDIIECGFLRDQRGEPGSTVFRFPGELKQYLPQKDYNSKYVLMFDAGKYDVNILPQNEDIIWGIRDCFHKEYMERAFADAKILVQKGYQVFIQPTGILQYTDREILELIDRTNEIGAYSFAIVDTFGSMNKQDLKHLFTLIDHNLNPNVHVSFHSHNNMQMAYALSQDFISMGTIGREIIVDSTVYGMGRGAGNACTECIAYYVNRYYNRQYDVDRLLDLIERHILQLYEQSPWGYTARSFVAGINNCHVDNVAYLYDKGNILSSDVKKILECIPDELRIHFNREALENASVGYWERRTDDTEAIAELRKKFEGRDVSLICPGKSIAEKQNVNLFLEGSNAVKVGVNFVPDEIEVEYVFFSNPQRFNFWREIAEERNIEIILTSNIKNDECGLKVNYSTLLTRGWKYYDNAMIMCLKLMDKLNAADFYFAGFDGYSAFEANYFDRSVEASKTLAEKEYINYELKSMLKEFKGNMKNRRKITFLTRSRFEEVVL